MNAFTPSLLRLSGQTNSNFGETSSIVYTMFATFNSATMRVHFVKGPISESKIAVTAATNSCLYN